MILGKHGLHRNRKSLISYKIIFLIKKQKFVKSQKKHILTKINVYDK